MTRQAHEDDKGRETPGIDDPAIAAAFLDVYMRDHEAGELRNARAYLELFPGHEAQIERELAKLQTSETSDAPPPDTSRRIGHYELSEELGRGAQGRVYRALDTKLKRFVALKVLDAGLRASQSMLARFRREAEIASRLDHPGIASVLDSGVAGGHTYIAMRLVEGQSLRDALPELRPETKRGYARVLEILEKAARAIHAAHEAGIVHRDLKPSNIMLNGDGDPVLLDFGLARDDELEASRLTATGDVFGTPLYMPPEQLRGIGADAQSDVYSLGATLYECLTLRPPFVTQSRETLYRAILEQELRSPNEWNRSVPRDLEVVVRTALAKDRSDRYPSALAFAEDLARVRKLEPIQARPASVFLRARRWVQRNRSIAALAGALFLVLTVSLVVISQKNLELARELEDANAGRLTKFQRAVDELVERGFQTLFSARPEGADAIFDDVLRLDPDNKFAIAGRVWSEADRAPERASSLLTGFEKRLPGDRDLAWLRSILGVDGENASSNAEENGASKSAVRCYLEGLRATQAFRSRDRNSARKALRHFGEAVLRAERPRFHHYHSWLMAAAIAGERETMTRASKLLEHHWPEASATHDAIAQFFLRSDPERAERSLRVLLTRADKAAAACLGMAQLARQRKAPEDALRWFDEAIARDAKFATAWLARGSFRAQHKDADGAATDYRQALALDARLYPASIGLARILAARGRGEEAAEVLEKSLELLPNNAALRAVLETIVRKD